MEFVNRLSDVINDWRETLDLEPVAVFDGPNLAATLKVPFTYCWSPALVPKPLDWPEHIGRFPCLYCPDMLGSTRTPNVY